MLVSSDVPTDKLGMSTSFTRLDIIRRVCRMFDCSRRIDVDNENDDNYIDEAAELALEAKFNTGMWQCLSDERTLFLTRNTYPFP